MSLVEAILFGSLEDVKRLVQAGADIEEIDEYGFSPLIEAAIANKLAVADLLLQSGAAVDSTDATGRTALHWAVDNQNIPLCQLLLSHHADPNAYTHSSQPLLIYPILRQQIALKNLLYQHGAQLSFAQDFIQAKLLGHRYELTGEVDIVNSKAAFIPVEYEGFFLEFTLDIVRYSLARYRRHFIARDFRAYFPYLDQAIQAFQVASELLRYQRYTIDIDQMAARIDPLLSQPLLLLPIAYEGHAISFVKYQRWLARCDRGENSKREGSVVIYELKDSARWTLSFVKQLLYQQQSEAFITQGIQAFLGLKKVMQLPLAAQLIGNCSWANIEASLPTLLFLLLMEAGHSKVTLQACQAQALLIHQDWLQWDKERALEECLKSFPYASRARKATKATLLGAVLFQTCQYQRADDLEKAIKLLPILTLPDYQYVLRSYLKVYWQDKKTPQGRNLTQFLDDYGVKLT